MPGKRAKCFIKGGYNPETNKVTVQFSDNTVYEYQDLSLSQWLEWKESYPRGTYFNVQYRYSAVAFNKIPDYPNGLTDEFIES